MTKEQEIDFTEKEHKGGQHKFAELPKICYECHLQEEIHKHNMEALAKYNPAKYAE